MDRFFRALQLILLSSALLALPNCGGGGGGPQAILTVSQAIAAFSAAFGGADPAPVPVNVANAGGGALNFTASSDSPWLTVTPSTGAAPQMLQVSAKLGALTTASYIGHISLTAAGAQGSPATITVTFNVAGPVPSNSPTWGQWGANPLHTGMVSVAAQNTAHLLADIIYDKFTTQEAAEGTPLFGGPALLVHYQAPLIDGMDVYMMTKGGTYISCSPVGDWQNGAPCGPNTWDQMIWNETRFSWENGQLIHIWDFQSDWKPVPDSINSAGIGVSEPVFHPADANDFIYVPGAGGTIWKVNKTDGTPAQHINPFANAGNVPKNTYILGPLTADASGNIFYNAIELADSSLGDPWLNEPVNSWLVKVTPQDSASMVTFATLTPNAPKATDACPVGYGFTFDPTTLPWPPAGFPATVTQPCGSQRPGANIAPAVAPDGTIYTASRPQFNRRFAAFLLAVNPDLTLKWSKPMQNLLNDGCGVTVPINDSSNSDVNLCRFGTAIGVDPTTNAKGSAFIIDGWTSSPTILSDGSLVFGASALYDAGRGYLFHFDSQGNYLNEFDFGLDSTPAVYTHKDGTYSLIIKNNHYPGPAYCRGNPGCVGIPEVYYITQVNPNKPDPSIPGKMLTEWSFQSTNTESCMRNPGGSITCTPTNPNGFEWCINAPAVDMNGTVYVNSEDGNIYALPQGHNGVFTVPQSNLFLNLALGAAYTPLALGPDGKSYTLNNGHLFVVGN